MRSEVAGVLQATLNSLSYTIIWRHVERQMAVGRSIIVDCPLARKELFNHGNAMAMRVSTATSRKSSQVQSGYQHIV